MPHAEHKLPSSTCPHKHPGVGLIPAWQDASVTEPPHQHRIGARTRPSFGGHTLTTSARRIARPALAIIYIALFALSFAYTQNLAHPLSDAVRTTLGLPTCLALIAYGYFLLKTLRRPTKSDIPTVIVSLILSLLWVLGCSLVQLKTIVPLFQGTNHVIKSLLAIATFSAFIYTLVTPLFDLILKPAEAKNTSEKSIASPAINNALDKLIRFAPVVLLVAWLPVIVSQLPGSTSYDINFMLSQFTGAMPWNTHHPIEATLLYGAIFSFGRIFGGDSAGVLFITLFQTAAFIAACTFELRALGQLKAPRGAILASLAFFALNPIFASYCQLAVKDSIFGTAFILYLTLFVLYAKDPTAFSARKRNIMALIVAAFLTGTLRKNGFYVVTLSLPFLALLHHGWRQRIKAVIPLVIAVALIPASGTILKSCFNAKPGGKAEALSLPIQQTARYALVNANDIEPWEREAINKTLDYEKLPQVYDWKISDPAKKTLHDTNALPEYLRAWLSQGRKHPETYLNATLLQTYGFWYPTLINDYKQEFTGFGIATNGSFTITRWTPEQVGKTGEAIPKTFKAIPALNHLAYMGIYTWAMLIAAALLLRSGRWRYLLCLVPNLSLLLTCIAGPLNGSMRYGLGIVATLPLMFVAAVFFARQSDSDKTKSDACG